MSEVITPIESLFIKLPLGGSPLGRMVLAGGAGAAVAYYGRPAMSFNKDGTPKPWILLDARNPDAAVFPWWAYIVLPAVTFGVFL